MGDSRLWCCPREDNQVNEEYYHEEYYCFNSECHQCQDTDHWDLCSFEFKIPLVLSRLIWLCITMNFINETFVRDPMFELYTYNIDTEILRLFLYVLICTVL